MSRSNNRIAVLLKDRCNPTTCNYLCINVCPVNKTGKECITLGEDGKPVIDELLCTGCGICVNRCPTEAIKIVNLPSQLDEDPIHRYGKNGFALYRLLAPQENKVVGVIGRNGIGKTTALKILSGLLKPNLGKEEVNEKELIEKLRGTESQRFMEKLLKGEIKPVYKPQRVELIAELNKTVKELLKGVNSNEKEIEEIAKELGIINILDRNVRVISGGELQRVAIAAMKLKKGNFYFIDEPSSYLDIRQRIRIANFIRKLTNESSIIVVDHDLLMMDYMADYVQLMYGTPSVYGIVTHPQVAKRGINQYLSGYIEEMNVKIRDKAISFDIGREEETIKEETIMKWEKGKEKLGDFELVINEGEIKRGEIIVILGENGIGKTSFVKRIAEKHDNEIKISYKPQYLEQREDIVKDFLRNEWIYENQLIKPLGIHHLQNKKLKELSGGELQRVYIAKALGRDADLYLLDEPSSYLDIEERLQLGKIIKDMLAFRNAAAIIVEHDLMLATSLAHRIIVFKGEPSIRGENGRVMNLEEGMNEFLRMINITMRKDPESKRPRINKIDSQLDKEQRKNNKYFY